jgi:hypothetical protein
MEMGVDIRDLGAAALGEWGAQIANCGANPWYYFGTAF